MTFEFIVWPKVIFCYYFFFSRLNADWPKERLDIFRKGRKGKHTHLVALVQCETFERKENFL